MRTEKLVTVELLNIKIMEAKEILIALSKAGMIEKGDTCMGKSLKKAIQITESGRINSQKEYLYTFEEIAYIEPSAIAYTHGSDKIFIYEID